MIARKTLLKLGRAFPQVTIAATEDGNVCLTLPNGKSFRIRAFDTNYGWRLVRKRIAQMIARSMNDSTTAWYQGIMLEDEDGSTNPMDGIYRQVCYQLRQCARPQRKSRSAGISIYHRKGTFSIIVPKQGLIIGAVDGVAFRVDFLRSRHEGDRRNRQSRHRR